MSETSGGGAPDRPAAPVARKRSVMPRSFHFSMGEALSRTLTCYGKNFPTLLIIGLVVFAPLILVQVNAGDKAWTQIMESRDEYISFGDAVVYHTELEAGPLGTLLTRGLPWFIQAVVTFGVFQFLRGQGMQGARSFGRGMERFFHVLAIAIMTALIMLLAMIPAGILIGMVAVGAGMIGIVIAGLLAMCVILAVMCIFFVSVQATIVERIGPSKALSRSAALTKGARWKIFGVVLILGIAGFVLQLILQAALIGDNPDSFAQVRTGLIAMTVVASVLAVLQGVAATVVYHDLRRAKEGVDLDELMSVFA